MKVKSYTYTVVIIQLDFLYLYLRNSGLIDFVLFLHNRDIIVQVWGREDFLNLVHQGCIYLIKNTIKTIIMWNIITI